MLASDFLWNSKITVRLKFRKSWSLWCTVTLLWRRFSDFECIIPKLDCRSPICGCSHLQELFGVDSVERKKVVTSLRISRDLPSIAWKLFRKQCPHALFKQSILTNPSGVVSGAFLWSRQYWQWPGDSIWDQDAVFGHLADSWTEWRWMASLYDQHQLLKSCSITCRVRPRQSGFLAWVPPNQRSSKVWYLEPNALRLRQNRRKDYGRIR